MVNMEWPASFRIADTEKNQSIRFSRITYKRLIKFAPKRPFSTSEGINIVCTLEVVVIGERGEVFLTSIFFFLRFLGLT